MSRETDTVPRTVSEDPNAVQIRVAPTWQCLVVPIHTPHAQLHHILQAAMAWMDSHLHQFEICGLRYGDPDLLNQDLYEGGAQAFDAIEARLRDFPFMKGEGLTSFYLYDFGAICRSVEKSEQRCVLLAIQAPDIGLS